MCYTCLLAWWVVGEMSWIWDRLACWLTSSLLRRARLTLCLRVASHGGLRSGRVGRLKGVQFFLRLAVCLAVAVRRETEAGEEVR